MDFPWRPAGRPANLKGRRTLPSSTCACSGSSCRRTRLPRYSEMLRPTRQTTKAKATGGHALQSDSPQFHDTINLSVSLCQQRFLTLGHRFKTDKMGLKSLDGVIGVLRDDASAL